MKNITKYTAIMMFAIISGLGIIGCTTAIDAQKNANKPVQKDQKEANENSENSENNENEGDEAKEGDEDEAKEQSSQASLEKEAKISRKQAEEIALKKIPGEIIEGDLEKEDGKLIYSFEIRKSDNTIFDVEVDANTGEVIKAQIDDDEEKEGNETNG